MCANTQTTCLAFGQGKGRAGQGGAGQGRAGVGWNIVEPYYTKVNATVRAESWRRGFDMGQGSFQTGRAGQGSLQHQHSTVEQ